MHAAGSGDALRQAELWLDDELPRSIRQLRHRARQELEATGVLERAEDEEEDPASAEEAAMTRDEILAGVVARLGRAQRIVLVEAHRHGFEFGRTAGKAWAGALRLFEETERQRSALETELSKREADTTLSAEERQRLQDQENVCFYRSVCMLALYKSSSMRSFGNAGDSRTQRHRCCSAAGY